MNQIDNPMEADPFCPDYLFACRLPISSDEQAIKAKETYPEIESVRDLHGVLNNHFLCNHVAIYNNKVVRGFDNVSDLCTHGGQVCYNHYEENEKVLRSRQFIERFNKKDSLLFHYTKLETAMLILLNQTLKYGRLSGMNDLNESSRIIFSTDTDTTAGICELANYAQISLVCQDKRYYRMGFDILPMWGHYADKGNGVCLVLDKEKIVKKAEIAGSFCKHVVYSRKYDNSISLDSNDVISEFQKKKDDIFFHKSSEWAYEQEFRIVKRTGGQDLYLDIEGAIVAIIVAQKKGVNDDCRERKIRCLSRIYPNVPVLYYGADFGKRTIRNEDGTTHFELRRKRGTYFLEEHNVCSILLND